ncbi:MAG: hypothetical protein A3B30_01925 [Candidatus Komeilibacteria bacterium RIFCSPLOWO2_01_FULL_52_15]|uniref:Translation elongation factor EFTu-like domain-containing protein n=1 Tax=Candidatus Komeilibacteria bacterium RIFCSPLOWO2_01_FULL_52_15 TaxID=1798551 RepID=A0A1G2BRM4_9BACT|nr:MAG: hypothetical protein A3B30_01925 [Candidatus Komeilibacteria bacterium RIFCSPLOWO2_01_FULL_52_15]
MKGTFRVATATIAPQSITISGEIRSGRLIPGMEAYVQSGVIIIEALFDKSGQELQKAGMKGSPLAIKCSYEGSALKDLSAGDILEFNDTKASSVKKGLVLTPEIG